ncbi:hypothetical protein PAXRUDRAFT_18337 [Paxillus rubicundulus Ve08.2h10]|uniref:Uncharacterized protein n=1 Tax=Paxillus rubicundulus Ve08.2h10 TaxID=930991 RepID=A0A0D0BYL5_9AGAM|nr:hypothetical protein PAXRUDRAFT_18337 [Paxillus rubicundulus Ve08.2h10]
MSDSAIKSASEDQSLAIQWALTSEEEDMPADLEEEEGEDEKEEADLDVIAESCQSVPAKFSKQELTIMMNAKPQWMSCRGAARKKVLETVLDQLYKLEGCKGLNNEAWSSRVHAYKTWFYNQCRGKGDRNAARYGQKVFHKFAQEMWRACGMRVVIMAGWKQEDSNMVTAIGDFNDEIADCHILCRASQLRLSGAHSGPSPLSPPSVSPFLRFSVPPHFRLLLNILVPVP